MILEVNVSNTITLREVYSSIMLATKDGEVFTICMRDSGFEFKYEGEWWEAKLGTVKKFNA